MTTHKKRPLKSIIEELEQQGYEVDIEHIRNYDVKQLGIGFNKTTLNPRGGITRAKIIKGKQLIAFADAHCSEEDNYSRKLGALIALGRAKKRLELDPIGKEFH